MKCELHELEGCDLCRPLTQTRSVVPQPFHYVVFHEHGRPITGIYHLPSCSFVGWYDGAHNSDRVEWTPEEVREGLRAGVLIKGCGTCHANVDAREEPAA